MSHKKQKSMRSKIQRSMILVLGITLFISFILITIMVYSQTLEHMKNEVKQEAQFVSDSVDRSGIEFFTRVKNFIGAKRLTWVSPDGTVLYDSKEDERNMENHKGRQEIKDALKKGEGESRRKSDTLDKQTYYYAMKLDDGTVIRISNTTDTVFATMQDVAPYMFFIALTMCLVAFFLARWQTDRLINPINKINLEHPLDNQIYEELHPLLENIENRNVMKEQTEKMRKEFSANVSHELKTPLTSISGYAELMKEGIARPEDIKVFSERIYHEASRLVSLIDDIIKLSRLEEDDITLDKEEVDLYKLSEEICDRLSLTAKKRNVSLICYGRSVVYKGIRIILSEMIYNLCENAIKYNVEGGTVTVWTGLTREGIKVMVEDTGIGIPKEEQERIFERFYRVDKSHSKETGGTGLGLSIVKHGALLHKADIRITSEPGKGTKMELIFHGDGVVDQKSE